MGGCQFYPLDKLISLVYDVYILVSKLSKLVERIYQTVKVTASGNNLFQLNRLGFVNCYLVREDDGFTLIDTTIGGQAQPIMQEARKVGLPTVRLVLRPRPIEPVGPPAALHDALPNEQA